MSNDPRENLDGKQKGANAEVRFNSPGLDAAWAKAGYCLEKRGRLDLQIGEMKRDPGKTKDEIDRFGNSAGKGGGCSTLLIVSVVVNVVGARQGRRNNQPKEISQQSSSSRTRAGEPTTDGGITVCSVRTSRKASGAPTSKICWMESGVVW